MPYMRQRLRLIFTLIFVNLLLTVPVQAQVIEIQKLLNALGLEAGPADGVAGGKTIRAWQEFLAHRKLPLDTPMDAAGLAEIRGQQNISFPKAQGIEFHVNTGRFPSKDTYSLIPGDPTGFSVTLRPGDYDTVNYTKSKDAQERQHGWSLFKQRAELDSQGIKAGKTYTVDFDVMISDSSAATFFQIHRGGSGGAIMLEAFPGSMRLNANEAIQNMAVIRGDWYGEWQHLRVVFHPSPDGRTWIRIYVNGAMTVDTSSIDPRYPMNEATLHFGLYRGASRGTTTTAMFRNISLTQGDLGAPETTEN